MNRFFTHLLVGMLFMSFQVSGTNPENEKLATSNGKYSTAECLSHILSHRYSAYSYDPTRPVTEEQLKLLIEAASLAPSSYNEQPWHFIICDRNKDKEAYEKILSTLVEFNQKWASKAPVLIISVAATHSSLNGKFNRFSQYDTGAAAFSMMLRATSLGLMAHQMAGYDDAKARELFSLPEGYVPMAVMAVVYLSSEEVQPERKRKPHSENFFMGRWNKS